MTKLTYGNHEIDTDKLPAQSIEALLRRGLSHYLGNEQASRLAGWANSQTEANTPPTDEAKAEKKAEFVTSALEALLAGTVGTRVSGPRVEPLEAAKLSIAKQEVTTVLRNAGIKPPKGEEAVVFADGTKKTLAQMVATRLERYGERIEKEAQARLRDVARKQKAAAEQAAQAESKTADALGV
jgi:hypothetical protein